MKSGAATSACISVRRAEIFDDGFSSKDSTAEIASWAKALDFIKSELGIKIGVNRSRVTVSRGQAACWRSSTPKSSGVTFASQELGAVFLKAVGNIFQENEAEDDVLVFSRLHVVAQLIGGEPELGLKPEIGTGAVGGWRIRFPSCHIVKFY